jgi:hypothetical protein
VRCAAYIHSLAGLDDVAGIWAATDDDGRRRIARAWAIRDALRAAHRHVRPLAVFPAGAA